MIITLDTLSAATEQQVFDHVANHLIRQGMPCIGPGVYSTATSCRYKHKELSCAVGSLMSPDEYRPWFEGKTWARLSKLASCPRHTLISCKSLPTYTTMPMT